MKLVVADPPAVVAITATTAATCAGVVNVNPVALLAPTVTAVPSTVRLVTLPRFVPVTVTTAPPAVMPRAGASEAIVGAAT